MNIKKYLDSAKQNGLFRELKEVTPLSSRTCCIDNDSTEYIDFSSNNYLGIANHPKLVEASIEWTKRYGTGSRASRLVSGTLPEYVELEERIAEWKSFPAALILGSGYLANCGAIPAIAPRGATIFADKLNHASLNSGCKVADGKFLRYSHNDIGKLSQQLKNSSDNSKLIVSDTVFSMDGDVADLQLLKECGNEHNATIYLDDAHATGLFGKKGEGLATSENCEIAMGTFSKGMGTYGACIACSKEMREYLINKCSSFVYTTALPPGCYGAISASIELIQSSEYCDIRNELLKKSAEFANSIKEIGFETGETKTPIIPVIIGDSAETMRISQYLREQGIFVGAIRPPTVQEGTARLRISLNATHTKDDIDKLLNALVAYISS